MMEGISAELASAALGLVGSLLLAIPFFADYFAKRKRRKMLASLDKAVFSAQDIAELRGPLEKIALEAIFAADAKMAACSALGCVLLVASFVILLFAKHGPAG
jgi:hypothetical protein